MLVFFSGEEKSFDDRLLFSLSLLLLSGFEEEYGDLDDVEESCRRRRMILFNPFSHRLGLLIPNKNERGGQHDDSSKTNSSVSRKKRGLFLPFASARSSPRSRAKVYVAGVKEREREREREIKQRDKAVSLFPMKGKF